MIDFPSGVMPSQIPEDKIFMLGLSVGVLVPLFHLIPISLISRYKITREELARIRAALEARKIDDARAPSTES